MSRCAMLIFQKNLVYGKVKTRLAATIGHDKAMELYQQLIHHTQEVVKDLSADVIVYDSDHKENDDWQESHQRKIQTGSDLGERMKNAFADAFKSGYEKVAIIGTDCPEITTQIIMDAFAGLNDSDIVIGPAADGGYYLLGMKQLHSELFESIQWSTRHVLAETIQRCRHTHLSYGLLPILHDVDEEKDLVYMKAIL